MPEERNDARQLSPVLENYLEIIFYQEIREGAARASSIAEAAGVSRSTVTSTLKALKSMGYVDYEPYSLVHLTEARVQADDGAEERHGDTRHDDGVHPGAQPHDEKGRQGGFGQAVQHHQVGL